MLVEQGWTRRSDWPQSSLKHRTVRCYCFSCGRGLQTKTASPCRAWCDGGRSAVPWHMVKADSAFLAAWKVDTLGKEMLSRDQGHWVVFAMSGLNNSKTLHVGIFTISFLRDYSVFKVKFRGKECNTAMPCYSYGKKWFPFLINSSTFLRDLNLDLGFSH